MSRLVCISREKAAMLLLFQALEIREGDRACLVARSKCHLQLGDNGRALDDAETSLGDDTEYHKVGQSYREFGNEVTTKLNIVNTKMIVTDPLLQTIS